MKNDRAKWKKAQWTILMIIFLTGASCNFGSGKAQGDLDVKEVTKKEKSIKKEGYRGVVLYPSDLISLGGRILGGPFKKGKPQSLGHPYRYPFGDPTKT